MAKISPFQNFPGLWSMIFSKKTIRKTSIQKIRKIYTGVWKLQVKTSQDCQFWPKNGQILVLRGQGGLTTFFGPNFFLAYHIALSFRKNILFTELKNLARSSNGGHSSKRRRRQISSFSIQFIQEKRDQGHTFLAFLGVKISSNYT